MFQILGRIFGSDKIIDGAKELIDEAFYTDTEKAEDKKEMSKFKANHKIELLNAYAPFKIAQRYIAFGFTFMFLFIMLNGILGSLYGWINIENVKQAKEFANTMYLGEIMLTIVAFYFGGGAIDSWSKKK
jgi:nucleoside permease NupC